MLNKINNKLIQLKAKALCAKSAIVNEDGSFHLEGISGAVIIVALSVVLMTVMIAVFGDGDTGLTGSLVDRIGAIFDGGDAVIGITPAL